MQFRWNFIATDNDGHTGVYSGMPEWDGQQWSAIKGTGKTWTDTMTVMGEPGTLWERVKMDAVFPYQIVEYMGAKWRKVSMFELADTEVFIECDDNPWTPIEEWNADDWSTSATFCVTVVKGINRWAGLAVIGPQTGRLIAVFDQSWPEGCSIIAFKPFGELYTLPVPPATCMTACDGLPCTYYEEIPSNRPDIVEGEIPFCTAEKVIYPKYGMPNCCQALNRCLVLDNSR